MANQTTPTEAAVFNPALISKEAALYTMPKLEFGNSVNRKLEAEAKIGKSIDLPFITRLTATQLSATAAITAVTYESPTESKVTISINQWWYTAFNVNDLEVALENQDLEGLYRKSGMDGLAVKIDADLASLAAGCSVYAGTLAVSLTDDNVLSAKNSLDNYDVPKEDRFFFFHPTQGIEFFKVDKYVNAMYRGTKPTETGKIGDLYGMTWVETTQVTSNTGGHDNLVFQRDYMGLVMRREPYVKQLDNPNVMAKQVVIAGIWGKAELRDAAAPIGYFGFWLKGL